MTSSLCLKRAKADEKKERRKRVRAKIRELLRSGGQQNVVRMVAQEESLSETTIYSILEGHR